MQPEPLALRVLIFEDVPGTWVAQVLEKDMAAHGPTAYAALAAVQLVLQAHVNFDTRHNLQRSRFPDAWVALQAHVNFDTRHNRQPLSRLKQAPDVYWRAYERAEPLTIPLDAPILLPAHISAAVSKESIRQPA